MESILAEAHLSVMNRIPQASEIITTLCAHEIELRDAGIRRLSVFGSVARGDAEPDSDVDVAAEIDRTAGLGLFGVVALERRLGEIVGHKVDLTLEPVEKERLRTNIERDRQRAF
jgi:predicted nucleotidyltransferase